MLPQLFSNDLLNQIHITRTQGLRQLRMILPNEGPLMRIIAPNLLDSINFSFDLLILLIMEQCIKHLIKIHLWGILLVLVRIAKQVIYHGLIVLRRFGLA